MPRSMMAWRVRGPPVSGKTQMCRKLMASGKYQCRLVSMDDHYWLYNSDKHIRLPEFDNYANLREPPERAKAELEACGPPEEAKLLLLEGILGAQPRPPLTGRVSEEETERVYEDDPVPDGYDTATVTWPMYAEHCAALSGRGLT
uniref:DNK domain-containing protein n=1 Tax=Macrostomum lignano TaxID=282301 RepID=A0A1I8F2I0_9PLAT